jgi:hypothetical protein
MSWNDFEYTTVTEWLLHNSYCGYQLESFQDNANPDERTLHNLLILFEFFPRFRPASAVPNTKPMVVIT